MMQRLVALTTFAVIGTLTLLSVWLDKQVPLPPADDLMIN